MTGTEDATGAFSPLLDDPAAAGVFTDFDGTLATIVDDPEDARPLPGVADALGRLTPRMGRVGVISGRPAQFLLDHLGGTGVSMWGLYGLERVDRDEDGGNPRVVPVPEAEEWQPVIEETAAKAEEEFGDELRVERKNLTLTVHYRSRPDLRSRAEEWVEGVAEATGLNVDEAKMSYELAPPVPHGKGVVLEKAAEGLRAACFFGDDLGDLGAFDALDRLAERDVAVVRVAVRSDEAPDELLERADLVVDGPPDVLELLEFLGRAGAS
jgi:trehalose 6-phosphate phosphatase